MARTPTVQPLPDAPPLPACSIDFNAYHDAVKAGEEDAAARAVIETATPAETLPEPEPDPPAEEPTGDAGDPPADPN